MTASGLGAALADATLRSARAIVARSRVAHPALNSVLLRRLSVSPGASGSLIADPAFEAAQDWETAVESLGDLAGGLLSEALVAALDAPGPYRMPRTRRPYTHQLAVWRETLEHGRSALVTAGTGSGKTEAFLLPILDDLLRHPRAAGGVRAILLYPLNALIESQRERLSAWAATLDGRVRFALYNGDTDETERDARLAGTPSTPIELRSREKVRARPPEILVTNVAMLEYLLLRAQDRAILDASQGTLRWIVLDEAHGYVGSQAAEMALLLRRVRAAFGAAPSAVRLVAASATIGGEVDKTERLRDFVAALAGRPETDVAVVEGRTVAPVLPPPGPDRALDPAALTALSEEALVAALADHPRVQALRHAMASGPVTLRQAARVVFDDEARRSDTEAVLDAVARSGLLRWRAHLFHRAQGGVWACADPGCTKRDPELADPSAAWPFGAVYLAPRARCDCGAPVFELVACTGCGAPHLEGRLIGGAQPRLEPPDPGEGDDFALDAEPGEDEARPLETGRAWLAAGPGVWLDSDGLVFDNQPPEGRAFPYTLLTDAQDRHCCGDAGRARLQGLRYGPPFLMGATLPVLLEALAPPIGGTELPAGGRRALSFSDSRQGVARLAAKLQQDAERTLTRAFLWHAVQEAPAADPARIAQIDEQLAKLGHDPIFADIAAGLRAERDTLGGATSASISWRKLVERFAGHPDLRTFAGEAWRDRGVGEAIADHPERLAEMFLWRELVRRPRVQNNPETMGLLRLAFPALETRARAMPVPAPLAARGLDADGWTGLALAAVDFVFRQNLAAEIPDWIVPVAVPRSGRRNAVARPEPGRNERAPGLRFWPGPTADRSRLVRAVYALAGGDPADRDARDNAADVLDALWGLVTQTACRHAGGGSFRLDPDRIEVARLDRGWLCPLTRRPFGYRVGAGGPFDAARPMAPLAFPRLPHADPMGPLPDRRAAIEAWTRDDPEVAALRARGLWTDLHDRIAAFPAFLRAQEHSAQIQRGPLSRYEQAFREGRINFLNCSTTMEMGVDIPDVRLVVNANVPPSLSNHRQRAGRAGRRGEPWAFALTYCRDLPLDAQAFDDPTAFLRRPIVAPRVWFGSPALAQRHVNAALLAAWLAERGGMNVKASVGAYFGATEELAATPQDAQADRLLDDLRGDWGADPSRAALLRPLVADTTLQDRPVAALVAAAAESLEHFAIAWRSEHHALLEAAAGHGETDPARVALTTRAKRLRGEFLLGELARRGVTPAYGFPTDIITFQSLKARSETGEGRIRLHARGSPAREMHVAIREYAPGADIVIDGLVHRSEGVLPAWGAGADASGLEDLRDLWSCPACGAFEVASQAPQTCLRCGHAGLDTRKVLRPAGFLGAAAPHTGYELLGHAIVDPVRLSAHGGSWRSLPDPAAGRTRADPRGLVAAVGSGPVAGGYALCLDCGRAEPMEPPQQGLLSPLPEAMRRHRPLARRKGVLPTADGFCRATDNPARIQRHVHLAAVARTDVWEWRLPAEATPAAALALAAALREALAERLGVEAREIGPAVATGPGPDGAPGVSAFLHDRAAGGAGLSARMEETAVFEAALARAVDLLDCPEECRRGCPACILRPDVNRRDPAPDRPGGHTLARDLLNRLAVPEALRVFGGETRVAGRAAAAHIRAALSSGRLVGLDLWLHGEPESWDFAGWSAARLLPRLEESGVNTRLLVRPSALAAAGLDLGAKLALHRLSGFAPLHLTEAGAEVGALPLLARLDLGDRAEVLAAADPCEAGPGPEWGAGAAGPLLVGPAMPPLPDAQASTERLIALAAGDARLLWPGAALDGPIGGFGNRFWDWLRTVAPMEIAALTAVGASRLTYSDRYLLTPLALSLLSRTLTATPGAKGTAVAIDLAAADRPPAEPRMIYDAFPADAERRAVLESLIPAAAVSLRVRSALPHHRALVAELRDGRRLTLLLDQGFGAWRAEGRATHDFRTAPASQARALARAAFNIKTADRRGAPVLTQMTK